MNILAVDIGNSRIKLALFCNGEKQPTEFIDGDNRESLKKVLTTLWEQVPQSRRSTEAKRDGVIVICSVKPKWTELVKELCKNELNEKALEIGIDKDIPLPLKLCVEYPATFVTAMFFDFA